jgi:hypothetical protein
MRDKTAIVDYARDNAEPAFTKFVYADTAGGEYASESGESFANTANEILFLVDDFIHKRGLFDPHNFSDSDWGAYSQKDLNDAISQLIVELHNDFT